MLKMKRRWRALPKQTGHKTRIMQTLKILWEYTDEEHFLSGPKIMELLKQYGYDADRKTVMDDIESLKNFGFDIDCQRNKGYYIISRSFEMSELVLLADAVQSCRFITEGKSKQIIEKLETLTGKHERDRLKRQLRVAGRVKTMKGSALVNVDILHSAINADKRVSFVYTDWNVDGVRVARHDGRRYRVSPWALCWEDEYYYLIGYDSDTQSIKHFRVDKMQNIRLSDERREGKEQAERFDIGSYSGKLFGMFGGEETLVTLRCKNSLAGVIIDRFGESVPRRKGDDGYFEVTVKVIPSPHLYSWVINFGGGIAIKSPQFAIDELKALAKEALSAYEEE